MYIPSPMINRITCDELAELLEPHLEGTPLHHISENRSFITDPPDSNLVATSTINTLTAIFNLMIGLTQQNGKKEVAEKIRGALNAISPYAS